MTKHQLLYKLFDYDKSTCQDIWDRCYDPILSFYTEEIILNPFEFDKYLVEKNYLCKKENSIINNVTIFFNNNQQKIELVKKIFD